MGSLERRIRNCMVGVRAELYDREFVGRGGAGGYLGARANGLAVETPAVRP